MKRELILQEGFETVERDEVGEVIREIVKYWGDDNCTRKLMAICGIPGTGKSFVAKSVSKNLQEEYNTAFVAYIDVSDCADEIEVYYKIAKELQAYYKNNNGLPGNNEKKVNKALEQFFIIYEWVYGKGRQYAVESSIESQSVLEATEIISEKLQKYIEYKNNDSNDYLDIVYQVLGEVVNIIPFVKLAKSIYSITVRTVEEKKLKQLMQDVVEVFSSKSTRETLLRNLLIFAVTGVNAKGEQEIQAGSYKPVIILDNFQLEATNELGRDQTWLSKPGSLMHSVDAIWIIVSRKSVVPQFEHIFEGNCSELELQGLDENGARRYLTLNCRYEDDLEVEEEYNQIIERMLEVCAVEEHHHVEQERAGITYLPYLLRMAVLHYRKLVLDPSCCISPEAFVKLRTEQEFFGYYFYKDLSDLMINAFQILSCLPYWDSLWIDLVRRKFDNHLLNARNVLFRTAPLEKLGEERFKLHEAIKDGLYNSSRNFIKDDVLKYLYDSFILIYGEDEAKKHGEIWFEPKRLTTFGELVYAYIKGREDDRQKFMCLKIPMKNIYAENGGRGTVSESFIRFYSQYIDEMREVYHIPFLRVQNADFSDVLEQKRKLESMFDNIELNELRIEDIDYYMDCCFNLGYLYTNNNQADIAVRLEILWLAFWENVEQKCNEEQLGELLLLSRQKQIKALNAIAYDLSAEHRYAEAYSYGTRGLELLANFVGNLLELLCAEARISPEEDSVLRIIANPENAEQFVINSCTEMDGRLYKKLVAAYKKLLCMAAKMDKSDLTSAERILSQIILLEHQNLRGNYPWYCLKYDDGLNGEECWKFGARTYWLRKARLQAAEELKEKNNSEKKEIEDLILKYKKKMLSSYHNVCVYLYKAGHTKIACILENEVIEESRRLLPIKENLSLPAQERFESIKNSKDNLFLELCRRQGLQLDKYEELCKKEEEIIEQIQYLGDYYLHLGFYSIAIKQFSTVMLWRVVRMGEKDGKTLDTVIRLFIASYAYDEQMYQLLKSYVDAILESYMKLKDVNSISKGLQDRYKWLQEIVAIGEKTDLTKDELVRDMLQKIDE